ncbi:MAG: hypothetical protein FWC33_02510 [Candidatus Bathyarchaeota archaeon]|nr:hypothetical protein [Candidatus Termiticorpusculum sp.]
MSDPVVHTCENCCHPYVEWLPPCSDCPECFADCTYMYECNNCPEYLPLFTLWESKEASL